MMIASRKVLLPLVVAAIVLAMLPAAVLTVVNQRAGAANPTGTCPSAPVELANASFESPVLPANSYRIMSQGLVPGWSTTAPTGNIEIWHQLFNNVPAYEGEQFAELNADSAGALYQDLPTTPGQTLVWSLHHRARQGTDTMYVDIGVPGQTLDRQATLTDNIAAGWVAHSGTYTVPAGQTITRFAFVSGKTGSGSDTVGNFIDDISFGTPSCVTATKSVSPSGPVEVGSTLTYSIALTNQGGSPTQNLVVTDPIPANTNYVAGSAGPNSSYSNGVVTVQPVGNAGTPGVLEPGATTTVSFQVVVGDAAAGTTVQNVGQVTETDGLGQVSTISTNQTSTPVDQGADVSITKSFTSPDIGGTFPTETSIGYVVTNHGPATATNVTFTDPLTAGLITTGSSTISASSGPGILCEPPGPTITCVIASLPSDSSVTFTLTHVTSSDLSANLVIANTATVTADQFDPDLANNSSTALLVVHPTATSLTIVKSVQTNQQQPATYSAGQDVTYSITAINSGTTDIAGFTITDALPTGFTPIASSLPQECSYVAPTVTCSYPAVTLTPGATQSVWIVEETDPGLAPATYADTASAQCIPVSPCAWGTTSTASVNIINDPELELTKSTVTPAVAGEPVTYALTLTSLGPSVANNAMVTDTLPATFPATTLASFESSDPCTLSDSVVQCTASGPLQPNTSVTFQYTVTLPATGGTYVNTAVGSADNSTSVDASNTVTVVAAPDLVVSKSVTPLTAPVGGLVTYTLTVSNQGLGTATGVVVNDDADEVGLQVAQTTAPAGAFDASTATWSVASLAPGETSSIKVTSKVLVRGMIVNTIIATAVDPLGTPPSKSASAYLNAPWLAATGMAFAPLVVWAAVLLLIGLVLFAIAMFLRRRNV